jgi:AcrR family transcriptional regulator
MPRRTETTPSPAAAPSPRTYRGESLAYRQAVRREQLIAAGIECFGQQGFHQTSVRALCTEAGLTERYFYESFPHSEALLIAVYDHLTATLQAQTEQAMAKVGRDPSAMARALLEIYFRFNEDPRIARITLFEILGVSPAVDARYRHCMQVYAQLIEAFLTELHPPGRAQPARLSLVAMGLVGAVVQIAMQWVLSGYEGSRRRAVESALSIFTAVLLQQSHPDRA